MAEEKRQSLGEGIRTGIGILASVKDAIEETLAEAVDRGDLSQERAKAAVRDAAERVQNTLENARERFDMVSRKEFEVLQREVGELRARLDLLENTTPAGATERGAGDSAPVD